MAEKLLIADFETDGIEPRPKYPPKPCGISLWPIGEWRKPQYFAWGHASKNNCTQEKARAEYRSWLRKGFKPVFHNAAFDCDVAEEHWGIQWPSEWHDTLLLAFLHDPRFASFALKPLGVKVLGMDPEERDELKDWIIANVPEAKRKPSSWAAYIPRAPGDLAGRYANGDTARTYGLLKVFLKDVMSDARLREAYVRELAVTPCLLEMERPGVPVRTRALEKDLPVRRKYLAETEKGILDRLKVPKAEREEFVFTGDCLADALERAGKVDEWILTDKGNRATNTDDLTEVCKDTKLVKELEVRAQLQTCVSTFMEPWLTQAREYDGRFYARFNQTRQTGGQREVGAVSGRLSMTPNLQNVIRPGKDPRVPALRDFIWSGARDLYLLERDYSQQELRILAHYEGGPFLKMYMENPKIDAHDAVGELIKRSVGITLIRRDVKDLNFGLIYGMGKGKLALKLRREEKEVGRLMNAHKASLPGVKLLQNSLKNAARDGHPLWTWGGRRYYCEEPKIIKGELRTFEYKMLNYLIQPSAADCTKQAMVNYRAAGYTKKWPLILQVHDSLLTSAPTKDERRAHEALRDCMADVRLKVPMMSDGKSGSVSWHRMHKVDY